LPNLALPRVFTRASAATVWACTPPGFRVEIPIISATFVLQRCLPKPGYPFLMGSLNVTDAHRPEQVATRVEGCVIPTAQKFVVPGISYAMVTGKVDSHPLEDYTDLPELEEDKPIRYVRHLLFGVFVGPDEILVRCPQKVITIEEVDDDEECPIDLDAWEKQFAAQASERNRDAILQLVRFHRRGKYARKNRRRRMRRREAALKSFLEDMMILDAINQLPQTQAGGHQPKISITVQNRNALIRRGVTPAEVVEFERHRDFSVKLFTYRQISRMYRDALQIRTAKARLAAAKAELDHKKEKLRQQRERAMARGEKVAEQSQGGIGIRIAGGAIGAAIGLVATTSVNTIARAFKKTSEKTNSFLDTITEQLKNFAKSLEQWGGAIKLALYSGLVWFLWTRFENDILRGVLIASFPLIFGKKIGAFVSKVFLKDSDDKPVLSQSYSSDSALPALIAMSVLFAAGIKGKPNVLAAGVAAVGILPRTIKGIECVLDFVVSGVQAVVNLLLRWIGRPEVRFRKQVDQAVDKAVKNAWELDRKMQAKDYDNSQSPQMYSKCMDSFAELVKLIALYHENVPVRLELIQVRNVMVGHCNSLKTVLGRGSGFRQEPLSILIESPPGKGKTMNIPVLIGVILKQSGILPDLTLDTLHQAFFTRPQNSDYFDGYHGQECYYIDDIFAKHQNPNGITQFDEVMAFYGNVTTMLNMAECEKKGMYPFNSSLLLMTTNAKTMSSIGASAHLLCPDAFKRRIDVHLHMDVKTAFQVKIGPRAGQLDYSLYRAELKKLADEGKQGFEAHPWYIWEAWETTFGDFEYKAGHGKCFSEFVPMFVESMIYKRESHMENMEHLRRVLQGGRYEIGKTEQSVSSEIKPAIEPVTEGLKSADFPNLTALSAGLMPVLGSSVSIDKPLTHQEGGVKRLVKEFDTEAAKKAVLPYVASAEILSTCEDRSHKKVPEEYRNNFPYAAGSVLEYIPPVPRKQSLPSDGIGGFEDDNVVLEHDSKPPSPTLVARLFGNDFAKKDLAAYYAEIWEQNKALCMIASAVVFFAAHKCVIKPLLSAIYGAYESVFKSMRGENQSNAPKPSNLVFKVAPPAQMQGPGPGLWKIVYDQTFKLVADKGDSYLPFGQVIMLADCLAVMPHHFMSLIMQYIDEGQLTHETPLILKNTNGDRVIMTINKFLSYPTFSDTAADLCFINFNKGFRLYRNIIDFFLKESDYATVGGRGVRLDVAAITGENMEERMPLDKVTYITPNVKVGNTVLRASKRTYTRWVQYEAATQFGDCGAPVSLTDYRYYSNRFVLGMHVAGTPATGEAFATLIPQELCKKAYSMFKIREIPEATFSQSMWSSDIDVTTLDEVPFTVDGRLGTAKPLYAVSSGVSIPVKSALVKTQIGRDDLFREEIAEMNDGHVPPNLVPMKLGPHRDSENPENIIFPMEEATRPFVGDVFLPDSSSFKIGLNVGMRRFGKATGKFDAPILTKEQAVAGEVKLGLKSLTRATSVGYPLCREAKDKRDYFGVEEKPDFTSVKAVQLLTEIDMLEDLIRQGYRPQFVCRDFLKDEVRKEGKGARLIAGTDLRYYILCRMYFGAFVGAVCRTHLESGLCLGLNPTSEWGALRRKLLTPDPSGKNVWDGDFAGFDSSQMPRLLWDCLDYINNWYSLHGGTQEENDIRTILFMDLVYSRHITGHQGVFTTVVEWCKSLPSGHFLTSTINSMISIGLIGAGYVGLTGRTDFSDTSAAVVQGDDNLVSTCDELVGVFNQVTLSSFLKKEFGMVYTAGRKGEDLKPVIGIDEVVFLQRRFAVKMGHDVCPIRPESFLSSMYYVHTQDAVRTKEVLLSSAENALEELSMHDEKYWDLVAPKLAAIKISYNDAPLHSTLTSADYLEVVRSRVPSYV
jgi:hypothetical protein